MLSKLYRRHGQEEFDRVLAGDLLWSTPDGVTVRLRQPCASVVDKDGADVQCFVFEGDGDFIQWLEGVVEHSTAQA